MKVMQQLSNDKLRGGFYTPAPLVKVCWDRIIALCAGREYLTVLEPSVGDGAFLRYLVAHSLASKVTQFVGLEIVEEEAAKCRQIARTASFNSCIHTTSALDWSVATDELFDIVVGNPPFVRYQFVPESDLRAIVLLSKRLDLPFRGVSNLWIPLLLGALSRLHPNGAMAVVVPAEIFTGLAAGDVRAWLLENFVNLRIDMFEPGSFPDVLQEVVVISGRRIENNSRDSTSKACVEFVEHSSVNIAMRWNHLLPPTTQNWTRYLLTPTQLAAWEEIQRLPNIYQLGDVAKFEVSIVTGANDFFSVTSEELTEFQLREWAYPLLPRIRYAEDLVYSGEDHKTTAANGVKAWLLNFSHEHPDPHAAPGPSQYLKLGEARGLATRYKTSIRSPWYRVPFVHPGTLLLSKRSHRFPRLVYNAARVVTTDTIYRGNLLPLYYGRELDLVAAFHNSITLLSAELEGRSFGGGVLELVPSEVARLTIPFPPNFREELPRLRRITRDQAFGESPDRLVMETDKLLTHYMPNLTPDLLEPLQRAREFLLQRRLSRN